MRNQLTGNSGLYHVARELSRRGWHVMPTVRNARGADLYAASDDESRVLPIQSKALSKRDPVPLGGSLDTLRSQWWVITINANSDSPTCYVLTLGEVKAAAHQASTAVAKCRTGCSRRRHTRRPSMRIVGRRPQLPCSVPRASRDNSGGLDWRHQ